jgi:hypothetical protein
MGFNPTCDHTFRCCGCAQEMTIHVRQLPEMATAEIECRENCKEGAEEGTIVNLHPDFPISEEDLHKDRAFPWLKNVAQLAKAQIATGVDPEKEALALAKLAGGQALDSLPELWAVVDRGWSLARSGRKELSEDVLKGYGRIGFEGPKELDSVLFDLCGFMIVPAYAALYKAALEHIRSISQGAPVEFERFQLYYQNELRAPALERYHEVLKEYFRDLSEFHQVLLLAKYGLPLASGTMASSSAFRRTKMFYGNAYEALTANFTFLACLNNVGSGRPFDQFKTMTLEKYVGLHKASRARAFAETEPFARFAANLNSGLRNASHHAAMRVLDTRQVIEYRSGRSGPMQRVRYVEYLAACTDLLLKSCCLLMIELQV